jgi:hypothetical protein
MISDLNVQIQKESVEAMMQEWDFYHGQLAFARFSYRSPLLNLRDENPLYKKLHVGRGK